MDRDSNFIDIDKSNLDDEWLNQPKLMLSYTEQLADAKNELSLAKAEHDLVEAEVEQDVRVYPEKYQVTRITEKVVSNIVLMSARYQLALKKVNVCKHLVDILQAAVDAIEHKKKALENLVHLFAIGYFSDPKKP